LDFAPQKNILLNGCEWLERTVQNVCLIVCWLKIGFDG